MTELAILGERCSGTNFLNYSLVENFDVLITSKYFNKHFFCNPLINLDDETIYIGIIREPYEYINSLIKAPHLIPTELMESHEKFLTSEFYSVDGINNEILQDRNYITGERYKNIYELIDVKYDYLKYIMPKKVKNYILIKYEDLRDKYEETLNKIQEKFNLIKLNEKYVKIKKYKGVYNHKFIKSDNYIIDKNLFYKYSEKYNFTKQINYFDEN